jgi:hypothetical protein
MAKKKTAKKGKRMAMGGLGMDDSDMRPASMPGRGMGREMEREEPEDGEARGRERGEMDDGMERGRDRERRMRRGRDREMDRGMKRGRMDGYGRPAIGGGLPPVQTMGPGSMPANPAPKMPAPMPLAGPTQNAVQRPMMQNQRPMMQNMGPNNMMPAKMRGGGIARKGKGLTMAKGGLVKGCGCAAKGVKKPRYT